MDGGMLSADAAEIHQLKQMSCSRVRSNETRVMDDDVINVERKRPTDEMSVKLNEVEVGLLCLVQVMIVIRKQTSQVFPQD
jgi:hypothetical protein